MTRVASLLVVCFAFALCASDDHVVAVVHGRSILANEIRPSAAEADAKRATLAPVEFEKWRVGEERKRLREKIWCELASVYVKKQHLAPSKAQIEAYSSRAGTPVCTTAAALSTEIFDQSIFEKYGGRAIERGSRRIPIEARQKYLDEIRGEGGVRIADAAYTDVLIEEQAAAFSIHRLGEENQVRIDCANGVHFVVRRRPDGRWSEEVRIREGAERVYKSVDDAAAQRCSGSQ